MSHLAYSGRSLHRTPDGRKLAELADEATKNMSCYSERIDSEVIVDFDRALEEVPAWRPNASDDHVFSETYSAETTSNFGIDIDGKWDAKIRREFLDAEEQKWRAWNTLGIDPTDESDRLIFPDRIFAFVLKNRRWGRLSTSLIRNITNKFCCSMLADWPGERWRTATQRTEATKRALNSQKAIARSCSHFSTRTFLKRNRDVFTSMWSRTKVKITLRPPVDQSYGYYMLTQCTGNGVIILLHGVPGVGKTSTAGTFLIRCLRYINKRN